ncbi:MAG TPA: hypothetical protein P5279_08360 [Anaerohalosphaeraceae bacterium]|nr:hypothetical protein [Anaerohalosphaeraceae bacterium]HRT50489.1 hypothetical protein [Anaerohalosphaeraceae bacterium]HRT86419.1 hypothetical protein [Anaerohalosphaeraceae bacterium]
MKALAYLKNLPLWRFAWHFLFAFLILITAVTWVISMVLSDLGPWPTETIMSLIGAIALVSALLAGFFSLLLLSSESIKTSKANGEKLENLVEMLTRNNSLLSGINQAARLSDEAKEIAFRDTERMELAEAVLSKLHQHDFEETYSMIRTMAQMDKYRALSEQLARTADSYRNATEKERINQVIAHIDELCAQYRWNQAAAQIENLIKAFPYSEEAKLMPRKLRERKDKRKRDLLAMWDEAVQSKDTDRSLEILKELDMYLTPTEGLALKESASSVFRTKLHNLGVQFALAVTERKWADALAAGQQIVRDFPNSRMSHEIRSKMDILQERARLAKKEPAEQAAT